MHPFLAFEDILKSYSISRIIIFICGIEGAGKLCSITRQPLSSACLLSMASWPQRTWWRQPSQLLTPLPPSLPTAPPAPTPGLLGGTLLPQLTLFVLSLHAALWRSPPLPMTLAALSLTLSSSSTPFCALLSFPFFFYPAWNEARKLVSVVVEPRQEGISQCPSLPLGKKLSVFI